MGSVAVPRSSSPGAATPSAIGATTTSGLVVESPASSLPDQSFYDGQSLTEGFQYIETRDGTKLSINVVLPGPIEDGPYPTVVEYSGYDPSNPIAGLGGVLPGGIDPTPLCGELPDPVQGARRAGVAAGRPDRLRGRRRQRARHRLLGRRLRLLRDAAGARRLRRRSRPSPPRTGCATTGSAWSACPTRASRSCSSRRRSRRAWPRSPRCRCSATRAPRRCARAGSSTPASPSSWADQVLANAEPVRAGLGAGARRRRRHDLRGEPARCALPERRRVAQGARQPLLHRGGRRPARHPPRSPATSTCRCSSPAPGRTSRPARPSSTCSTASTRAPVTRFTLYNGAARRRLRAAGALRVERLPRPLRGRRGAEHPAAGAEPHAACSRSAIFGGAVRDAAGPLGGRGLRASRWRASRPSRPVRVLFESGGGAAAGAARRARSSTACPRGPTRRARARAGGSTPTARCADAAAPTSRRRRRIEPDPAAGRRTFWSGEQLRHLEGARRPSTGSRRAPGKEAAFETAPLAATIDHARHRQRRPVGAVRRRRRRPRGRAVRGAARRRGDARAVRPAAGQLPSARAGVHRAAPDPARAGGGRRAAARRAGPRCGC